MSVITTPGFNDLKATMEQLKLPHVIIKDSQPVILLKELDAMCLYDGREWVWKLFIGTLRTALPITSLERFSELLEIAATIMACKAAQARLKSVILTEFP